MNCIVYNVNCHCELYSVKGDLYTVNSKSTIYSEPYVLYTLQRTFYTVLYTIGFYLYTVHCVVCEVHIMREAEEVMEGGRGCELDWEVRGAAEEAGEGKEKGS